MLIVSAIAIIYALYFKPVKKQKEVPEQQQISKVEATPLDLTDEDATVSLFSGQYRLLQ